jgi:hypothetical protein
MAQRLNEPPADPGGDRPRAARLAQGLLIVAIMVLIVIAVISFN